MPKLIVIGPGRLGTALALALKAAGHSILGAFAPSSNSESSEGFLRLTGTPVFPFDALEQQLALVQSADGVLVTVPDKAVSLIAQTLHKTKAHRAGQVVVHTAGALSSLALSPLQESGVSIGSMHPLQTFADPLLGSKRFRGVTVSIEGDEPAVAFARQLIEDLGGKPVVIPAEAKPRYHAAAVLASNAVIALASVASELLELPGALNALLPLMQGALENLDALGLPQALTGPVDRKDQATLLSHLKALQNNPTALQVYCALGEATVEVAKRKGSLTQADEQALLRLFQDTSLRRLPSQDPMDT